MSGDPAERRNAREELHKRLRPPRDPEFWAIVVAWVTVATLVGCALLAWAWL